MSRPLKELHPVPHEERVQAVWNRIEASRVSTPSHPKAWIGVAAVALLGAGLIYLASASGPAPLTLEDGSLLPEHMTFSGPTTVPLSDGSRLTFDSEAELDVLLNETSVFELVHRAGEIRYEVHRAGRRWVVDSGTATVEVIGTEFSIRRTGAQVQISVIEGVVVVRSAELEDGVMRVGQGEVLTLGQAQEAREAPTITASLESSAMEEEAPELGASRAEFEDRSHPAPTPSNEEPEPAVSEALESLVDEPPLPEAEPADPTTLTSEELLAQADDARRAGAVGEAESLLTIVTARRDERSAVAAFTLARLRQRRDPHRAATGFADALRLGLAEPLRRA
ncbi:MAG: FecR domain-containing protein, partial [Myxococcota bacterium]